MIQHSHRGGVWCVAIGVGAVLGLSAGNSQAQMTSPEPAPPPGLTLEQPKPGIWQQGLGEGFRPGTKSFSLLAGAAAGLQAFGSEQRHDLALLSLSYGRMTGRVMGQGHWWGGNWELRGELFGGAEFSPDTEWLVGLTPHLRNNFATGHRWIPFLDAGAGVTATGIGPPDLSNTFEFNLQGGAGLHCFLRDNLSLSFEARYLHLSCAHISQPNKGLNSLIGLVGLTWFF